MKDRAWYGLEKYELAEQCKRTLNQIYDMASLNSFHRVEKPWEQTEEGYMMNPSQTKMKL